jgi:16S rRNA (adenine(1408)-N(1))-methyltransferase
VAALSDNLIDKPSSGLSPLTGEGIVIDIGTGDGLFAYQCARQNPEKFYIGIDANARPLEKLSRKIDRKPSKGGLPNLLFIQAAVEDLPPELDEVADELHVHFPWGSLLGAVASGDEKVLESLRRLCSPGCLLEILIGVDPERDRSEIERLGLKPLATGYLEDELIPRYEAAGFEVLDSGVLGQSEWSKINTSWARRLKGNEGRKVIFILGRATVAHNRREEE